MIQLPVDPIAQGGLADYAVRLRKGEIAAEAATKAYLARIEVLDPKLGAYQFVARDQAIAAARAIDSLLKAGIDLGPLMGVPVAIKDLFAVEGTPATAGSLMELEDIIGVEGSFVKSLKRAGCVVLGKTKTVEFALGITGVSTPRGTPWNPWDATTQRLPGGSSSGSAVAVAAGLCAFAIGSDTGGSVRVPAALNGIFGLKTTAGLFPTDGVFPLSRDLDTIGPLTKSAADAAIVLGALTGKPAAPAAPLKGLRLGKPEGYFYRNLDSEVAACVDQALDRLAKAGVEIVLIDVPEAPEREAYFPVVLPSCLIAVLGKDRYQANRSKLDPIVATRADNAFKVSGFDVIRLESRRREACRIVDRERFQGLDGWVTPTATILPPAVKDLDDPNRAMQLTLGMTQASQPANYMGLCATSTPINGLGAKLPVGLQIICPAGQDAKAVSIGRAIENAVGPAPIPDLRAFAGR